MLPLNATMGLHPDFPYLSFTPGKTEQKLFFTTLIEPFMTHLKIAFISGPC